MDPLHEASQQNYKTMRLDDRRSYPVLGLKAAIINDFREVRETSRIRRKKRIASVVVHMACECGYKWQAIFSSGICRREVTCHGCQATLKTSSGERVQ